MPRGVYDHSKGKTKKAVVMEFVKFTFRPDIAEQLAKVKKGAYAAYGLAVELYHNETGILINPKTAYNQKGKWVEIDGEIHLKSKLLKNVKKQRGPKDPAASLTQRKKK